MANYSVLKAAVQAVVKTNGNQEITGANMQSTLISIINSLGTGYQFMGVATPSTSPGTPDYNVAYIGGAGTYANFGTSVVVPPTNIAVFKYNGTWTCEQVTVENGGVFDISAFNAVGGTLATYADLATALGTNGVNVPEGVRKGGMSIKFVQSSDNKYVQYRLMSDTFNTTVANWQGVDDEPVAGSKNLVKSGGVKKLIGGTKTEVKPSDGVVWMFSDFLKGFIGESVYIRSKQFTISCMLYDDAVELVRIGTSYTQVDLSNVSNPRILISSSYSQGYSFSLDIIPQSLLKELIDNNTAAISSLGSDMSDLANDISEIQEFINSKSYFASDTTVGYITPDGAYSSSDIGAVVTQAIPVTEGDVWHFEGGWQNNSQFGSVWGYTGLSFNNGVKILDCLAYQSTDFVVPAGVNYLRAWSLTSKNPVILSANNLDNKISETVAEKVKIDWDNAKVITATRNAVDYNSIREIMQSITDATAGRPYIILVPVGRWHECDIQGKKYVRIVGEDRERTIIYNDGTSSHLTPSDYSYPSESNKALSSVDKIYKHIIFAKDDVNIFNVTLELTTGKYCTHLDDIGFTNVKLINCHLIGKDVNYDIGIGIRGGQNIDVDRCIIESVDTGKLGVFAHNWNNQEKPSAINITNTYFKNCGFICIDELGSEQEDAWNLLNCYSDVGGAINCMVDNNGSTTYWINENNVLESDPTKVPYCIKLNCCGSNVGKVQKNRFASTTTVARPNILKYIIADCILAIDGTYNVDSHLCGYVSGNSVVIGENNNTTLPFIGVVDSIVSGKCYVIKKGHTVIVSIENIYGTGAGIGNLVYRRDNGYLTTAQSQSIDNIPVGIIWGDYYGVGRQIVLFD